VDGLSGWVRENWFTLLQGIGIVAGLFFTAVSIRQQTRARRISDLLTLTAQHRELWGEIQRQPLLSRVLSRNVDLIANPISAIEEEFLNTVIVHFSTGWQLARDGALVPLKAMRVDTRMFFSLPIPRAVWEQSKPIRDPKFVRFVESCLPR
jgi:hypothetical protein